MNAEVNPDELATTYHFEYGETTAYGTEVPLGGASIGSGAIPVPVSAPLEQTEARRDLPLPGRSPKTARDHDRSGPDFTTIPPAPMDASYATGVSATEATLHTPDQPAGQRHHLLLPVRHRRAARPARPRARTARPRPAKTSAQAKTTSPRASTLTGLAPDTTYHYRVIAINTLGEHRRARAHASRPRSPHRPFALPDNRAWEMVTPPNKRGAPVEALTREGGVILASEDGDRLTYVVDGALGEDVAGQPQPRNAADPRHAGANANGNPGHRHAQRQSQGRHARPGARVPVLHARPVNRARRTCGRRHRRNRRSPPA